MVHYHAGVLVCKRISSFVEVLTHFLFTPHHAARSLLRAFLPHCHGVRGSWGRDLSRGRFSSGDAVCSKCGSITHRRGGCVHPPSCCLRSTRRPGQRSRTRPVSALWDKKTRQALLPTSSYVGWHFTERIPLKPRSLPPSTFVRGTRPPCGHGRHRPC